MKKLELGVVYSFLLRREHNVPLPVVKVRRSKRLKPNTDKDIRFAGVLMRVKGTLFVQSVERDVASGKLDYGPNCFALYDYHGIHYTPLQKENCFLPVEFWHRKLEAFSLHVDFIHHICRACFAFVCCNWKCKWIPQKDIVRYICTFLMQTRHDIGTWKRL